MATTEHDTARKTREALALVIGIARAHREMPYSTEEELRGALERIEEYGCQAMPWLREVKVEA